MIKDNKFDVLCQSIKDSYNDCLDELGYVDYETCIDHWQQRYIDDLEELYPDVDFYQGYNVYDNAQITLDGDYYYNLRAIYELIDSEMKK